MTSRRHPELRIQTLTIGREHIPLAVIDNVVAEPAQLAALAAGKLFAGVTSYYPGIRSKAPLSYTQFVIAEFATLFATHFGLGGRTLRMTQCHFSLVTTPPEKLTYLQSIPHVDAYASDELAFVHYLFKRDLGGTAFYRHRRTGFEFVDFDRKQQFISLVEQERNGPDRPAPGYINGDTALYEQIGRQEGVFNRMVLYRRNTLHSGCIGPDFKPDPSPLTGRLSLNGFIA
jgi:hypothetical protein